MFGIIANLFSFAKYFQISMYKTGGGPYQRFSDEMDAKLAALLPNQFVPLSNSDSDAGFHDEVIYIYKSTMLRLETWL